MIAGIVSAYLKRQIILEEKQEQLFMNVLATMLNTNSWKSMILITPSRLKSVPTLKEGYTRKNVKYAVRVSILNSQAGLTGTKIPWAKIF